MTHHWTSEGALASLPCNDFGDTQTQQEPRLGDIIHRGDAARFCDPSKTLEVPAPSLVQLLIVESIVEQVSARELRSTTGVARRSQHDAAFDARGRVRTNLPLFHLAHDLRKH